MDHAPADHVKTVPASRRQGRRWPIPVLIVVAGGAVAAFVSWPGGDGGVPRLQVSLASVATTDSQVSYLLGDPIWSELRGDGEGALSPVARAIRLGATIASYEMRRQRSDSTLADAQDVARILETFPNGADAAAGYRKLSSVTVRDSELQSAARLAEHTGGIRAVRLGAWLQGARFAAAVADTTWFDGRSARAVSQAVIAIDKRAESEAAARQLEQVLRQRPRHWPSIGTACEDLLRLLGGR